ncbi:hypothetical protein C8F01DRAFT_1161371 [Mycena amicta]|nr:hypothetical protein C8F01DRAFT_1161371 [Mycena amicta]
MRGWCISEEDDDEGGYKVLRLTPEDKDREAIDLVFVAEDMQELSTHVPAITSLILQPFRSLASVLRSPSAMPIHPEDDDDDEDDLISALLASDASPLYTALLVMSVSGSDEQRRGQEHGQGQDNEGKMPDALRRLVPVLVLDQPLNQGDKHSARAAYSPPRPSSSPSPSPSPPPPHPLANPGEDAPHVDPNPIATIPVSPASPSLFSFEGDGDPGDDALVSPSAPAPSAATTSSTSTATSSASDPDGDHDAPALPDEDPDPEPPLATTRPLITIHDNTHDPLPKPDQSTFPFPGLTPHKIRELRRDAAGLFVDWWDAEASVNARGARHAKAYDAFYLPHSRTNPPSSIASASASATRSTSRKQRHRHHGHHHHSPWPFTPYSVNVTDPLHLPSLLRLVRDVVWGSVSGSVSGVWGTFVAGLVLGVGIGVGIVASVGWGWERV